MVAKQALTDLKIRTVPLPDIGHKTIWDTIPGFGVRCSKTGTRTFFLKHKNQFITIGRYPILTLSEARQEAKRIKAEFTLGRLRPAAMSYAEAVDAFLEERKPHLRPNSLRSYTRHLKCFHFSTKVAELTQHDLARQLKSLATRPSEHNHSVGTWIIFFNWCLKREYVTRNPAIHLPLFPKVSRSRVLTDQELKAVWTAAGQITGHFGTLVKLLILMGQRVTETASIQTSWINQPNQTLTFPLEITKNKKEHTIPIGSLSASLLSPLLDAYNQTIQSSGSPSFFLSSLLLPARGKSDRYFTGRHQMANLRKLSGFKDFCLHDLRRTFATTMASLDVQPHIIERLLNHTTGQGTLVAQIYNRHKYLEEMRAAVSRYEEHLKTILDLE